MEDRHHNDGNEEKPFFGPKEFFENFENAMDENDTETGLLAHWRLVVVALLT